MACKLSKSLGNKSCSYAIAGAALLYLANWYPMVEGAEAVEGAIAYTTDAEGVITSIKLPVGESFYKIQAAQETLSFTDALTAGGSGAKFRTHTVNATLNQLDTDILDEADALSLGRFIAVVVDNAGRVILLGRQGGLSASQFDYNSWAAMADATGWTHVLAGAQGETIKELASVAVVTPVQEDVIEP